MRIAIDHTLRLSLLPGPGQAMLHLLLTPESGPTQTVEGWDLVLEGIETAGRFIDAFGNPVHLVNHARREGDIVIRVKGVVATRDTHGVLGKPAGEPVPALYKRVTEAAKADEDLLARFAESPERRLDVLHALMAAVGEQLGVAERAAQSQMQVDGSQAQSQGVAGELPPSADYAHAFIGVARQLDIPARYVVGYLAEDEAADGLHAWAEAYDEGLGWIGFDPKLGVCTTERHVRLAVGLDAETALPLRSVPVGEVLQVVGVRAE